MRRRRAEAGDDEKLLMSYAFFLTPALVTLDLVWASEPGSMEKVPRLRAKSNQFIHTPTALAVYTSLNICPN